jgi:hypothetical protein
MVNRKIRHYWHHEIASLPRVSNEISFREMEAKLILLFREMNSSHVTLTRMDTEMQHGHEQAAWTWNLTLTGLGHGLGHEHAEWIWTLICSLDMDTDMVM